jgi:hypothetical protein
MKQTNYIPPPLPPPLQSSMIASTHPEAYNPPSFTSPRQIQTRIQSHDGNPSKKSKAREPRHPFGEKERVRFCCGFCNPSRGLRAFWIEILGILIMVFGLYIILYAWGERQRRADKEQKLRESWAIPLSEGGV